MKLITGDEAYHDDEGLLQKETGVELIKPPSKEVKLPEDVDAVDLTVTCDELCDIPMRRMGTVDRQHEFKCNALSGECQCFENCPRFRFIPVEKGVFQSIPLDGALAQAVLDIRKNCERPFNLLKHSATSRNQKN